MPEQSFARQYDSPRASGSSGCWGA